MWQIKVLDNWFPLTIQNRIQNIINHKNSWIIMIVVIIFRGTVQKLTGISYKVLGLMAIHFRIVKI